MAATASKFPHTYAFWLHDRGGALRSAQLALSRLPDDAVTGSLLTAG